MKIVFEVDNVLDAAAVAELLAQRHGLSDAGQDTEVKPRRQPRAAKPAEPSEDSTDNPKEEKSAAKETKKAQKDEEDLTGTPEKPKATRQQAADAIVALSKKKGRSAAVAVLEQFRPEGYEEPEVKLPAVSEADYGNLVAAAKKALSV